MCPVAAKSKNSNPSSNKKIDSNLETLREEEEIFQNQDISKNSHQNSLNDAQGSENNTEFNNPDDESKALGNIKLGPKGIYTEDSIRVYLQEIGRIRL